MMAQPILVRPATQADAHRLAVSRFRFRSRTDATGPLAAGAPLEVEGHFVARATHVIDERLRSGRWFAWIAEQGDAVVGHLFLQLVEKLPNPSPSEPETLGYLTSFFVEPDSRGGGVGGRLLDALESFAARAGVEKIFMSGATPMSRPLYARRGYRSSDDLLEKRL